MEGLNNKDLMWQFHFRPHEYYLINYRGELNFDYIGRFENIVDDYRHIAGKMGVRGELPHLNKTKTLSGSQDYRSAYTDEMMERVGQVYQADVNLLGYEF